MITRSKVLYIVRDDDCLLPVTWAINGNIMHTRVSKYNRVALNITTTLICRPPLSLVRHECENETLVIEIFRILICVMLQKASERDYCTGVMTICM